MRGLARWTGTGGSYRTIQRFFTTSINWTTLQWVLIRHHLLEPDDVIVLGGDDVVVTKAGKHTYGLDRFFGSLVIPGIHNSMIFMANKECPYKSSWIL